MKPKLPEKIIDELKLQFTGPGANERVEATRLTLRQRCKESLWYFNRYALEMEDIETPLHADMCNTWQKRMKKRFSIWLIPRGHLKTSCWTEGGTLFEFIQEPHQRHLVINAKLENSVALIANIRQHTLTKEVFRWLFPEYCLDLAPKHIKKQCKDLQDRIDFPCSRYIGSKEGCVSVMAVEASLVSRHFDKLTFDDPVNDINCNTKEYRDKVDTWFKNALQLRHSPRESRVALVGTRWHFDDLYSRRIKEEMARREEQAQSGKKIKPRYFIYTRKATEVRNGKRVSIWPERYPVAELDRIRDEVGSYVYSCQYENDPLPEENAVFKHTDIQVINSVYIPDEVVNFMAVDLAQTEEENKGDFTAITVASFDKEGKMYVREIQRVKIFPLEAIEIIIRLQRNWKCKRVGIETTAFQKTIYRAQKIECVKRGVSIPWHEINHSRSSKRKRFLALQPRVERKEFFVQAGIKNLDWLMEEMSSYSVQSDRGGAHDDILDTLADLETMYYAAPKSDQTVEATDTFDALYGKLDLDDGEDNEEVSDLVYLSDDT